jgi:hypothetical protein
VRISALLLADAAQIDSEGKISALGLGWTGVVSPTPPIAIVLCVEVQPDEVPANFEVRFELLDADQNPWTPPDQTEPFILRGAGSVVPKDPPNPVPSLIPMALTLGPGIPLEPGIYHFRSTLEPSGGEAVSEQVVFLVRPRPPQPPPPPANSTP